MLVRLAGWIPLLADLAASKHAELVPVLRGGLRRWVRRHLV